MIPLVEQLRAIGVNDLPETAEFAEPAGGHSPARPYREAGYVGRWLQREPAASSPVHWTVDADRTFSAPGSAFEGRTRWCFHRNSARENDGAIWLDDRHSGTHKKLLVQRVSASQLELQTTTPSIILLERA